MHLWIIIEAVMVCCMVTTVFATSGHSDKCTFLEDILYGGQRAVCKGQGLTHIPQDLPKDIVALDLAENRIPSLPKHAFSSYSNLKFLDLSKNMIRRIDKTAFKSLFHLTSLNLALNPLSENYSFPRDLFSDLHNLYTLNLERNFMQSYPEWVFPSLISLHTLYIQSIPRPEFGRVFSKLVNLTVLKMDSDIYRQIFNPPWCYVERLTNTTFLHLRNIETLVLNHCSLLHTAEASALEPLVSLKHLELTHNHIGIQNALYLLKPLSGRNMTRLWLNSTYISTVNKTSDMMDHILTRQSTLYLRNMCVFELSRSENLITLIEIDTFNGSRFQECVVKMDLSKNFLLGNFYQGQNMSKFSRLAYLYMSYQRLSFYSTVPQQGNYENHLHNVNVAINVTLPKNLIHLDLTGILYYPVGHSVTARIKNADNLKTFLFGYNKISNRIHFEGLDNITNLDLSGHSFYLVNGTFFSSYRNIKALTLKNCGLSTAPHFSNILINLHKLKRLDISNNNLQHVPRFAREDLITELNLSHNSYHTIPINPVVHRNLRLLDMSFNSIGHLDKGKRQELENAHLKSKLQVSVKGNIFSCSCENLDFILWLMDTKVLYETERSFSCFLDNGTTTTTENVYWNYQRISRGCSGAFSLTVTLTLFLVFILSLVIAKMVSKSPTRYRCLINKLLGFGITLLTPEDFDFTLYIGYTQDDIPFVFRRLRPSLEECINPIHLFLKDREVLPGVDIADGVIEGINNSWKTLLVVSRDFLDDPWSNLTINTAVYSMTDQIPNRIIVLLVDDVQELSETLLNAVEEECILHSSDYEDKEERLWRRLREVGQL